MTKVECTNNHVYDADRYSTCPYCNGGFQTVDFGGVPVGEGGVTMPGGSIYNGNQRSVVDDNNTKPPRGYEQSVVDDEKTKPPRGYKTKKVDDDIKTMPINIFGEKVEDGESDNKPGNGIDLPYNEPVVGWLVCIEGKNKGKDYRLYGRINTIGRSERMDVCIQGDSGITRDVHAKIGYDPRFNKFHIIPANGTNNTYVNGNTVYMQIELHSYDVIEMSNTKLLFISMCNHNFSWSNGLNRGGDNAVF